MLKKHITLIATTVLMFCLGVQAASDTPVSADKAFVMTATAHDAKTLSVRFKIIPGYYLYKNHLNFRLEQPEQGTLQAPTLPKAIKKHVEDLGVFDVYTDLVNIDIPLSTKATTNTLNLIVSYQGCSDAGYCYPPVSKKVALSLNQGFGHYVSGTTIDTMTYDEEGAPQTPATTAQDRVTQLLQDQGLLTILVSFFGFGLLLAFTPCVLPMVPILSSIIVGQKNNIKTSRAFLLSLTYVLAMSFAYAIAGVLVGFAGGSIQAMMQTPWFIGFASALFVALALSLFGLYELRLPRGIQNRLTRLSNNQAGGSYIGVAIMGFLAALIVSPCVTPALVGALGYIAKTGNALLGGTALFTLGLGMGLPLLIIGTAGGKLLPKAGGWMHAVSHFFGVVMLGMAIWMLDRILPSQVTLALWACLAIIVSAFLGNYVQDNQKNHRHLFRGVGTILLVYGSLMLVGVSMGNSNPLHPLDGLNVGHSASTYVPEDYFQEIKSVDEVKQKVKKSKKIVILDFYADWCTACKLMDKNVINNPKVKPLLDNFTFLKANVTRNNADDKALQQFFSVIAPPTYVFLTPDGKELEDQRIVGEMDADEFKSHLQRMLNQL